MVEVENPMVVDWWWKPFEANVVDEPEEVLAEKGYHEIGTHTFVKEEDAFSYALERCLCGAEEEQKEFKEMLVDWFYSGNWIKE